MDFLTHSEEILFSLRSLYEQYGYRRFKMSKFEEYSLYAKYKNFLTAENIITFTDLNGKLLALKPDITLSIAKNAHDGETQRVYYNENVYRESRNTHEYKEITQVGLEHIGNIDLYSMCEVVLLAVKSLSAVSDRHIMDISHMGFIAGMFDYAGITEPNREKIIEFMGKKDTHEIRELCDSLDIGSENTERIVSLTSIYGPFGQTIGQVKKLVVNERMQSAVDELESIYNMLLSVGEEEGFNLDFSIVNDMNYYNGIVFQGYVSDVPCSVLSGGRYDYLLHKLGKSSQAIGFAVYMDLLELYSRQNSEYDADVLLVYDKQADAVGLSKAVDSLVCAGKHVVVRCGDKADVRYKQLMRYQDGGVTVIEGND